VTTKFEVGTLVVLKSGGPTMTVTSIRDQSDGVVHCEWFASNELKREAFDIVNLTSAIIPQFPHYVAPPNTAGYAPHGPFIFSDVSSTYAVSG
jgi:uncharacterized protein YodC (DUF2158 family)